VQQLLLDLALLPAPTLDNFALGRNAEPVQALRAWLGGGGESCLYLWGPPGCGKTHLLGAAAVQAREQGVPAQCVAAPRLAGGDWLQTSSWLAIDDVHALPAAGQASLFTLLNRAIQGDLRLLLAGAIAPAGLTLREDVRTRLAAALVFQLHPLDDEEKAAALQAHARERGFELSPEAAQYVLRHGRRDLRWLLTVIDALDRYSLQTRRPVTLPLLREVLNAGDAGATSAGSSSAP
jgi:DnaA family protein